MLLVCLQVVVVQVGLLVLMALKMAMKRALIVVALVALHVLLLQLVQMALRMAMKKVLIVVVLIAIHVLQVVAMLQVVYLLPVLEPKEQD